MNSILLFLAIPVFANINPSHGPNGNIPSINTSSVNATGAIYSATSLGSGDDLTVVDTATIKGNAFSVGSSTLAVLGGNVGVGTSAPDTKLRIVGNVKSDQVVNTADVDGTIYNLFRTTAGTSSPALNAEVTVLRGQYDWRKGDNQTFIGNAVEGVFSSRANDESATGRGVYGRFYVDTDADATASLRTGIGGEFSARAGRLGGVDATAESGTAFVGVRSWMAPYFTAASTPNINNFHAFWGYNEHPTVPVTNGFKLSYAPGGGGFTNDLNLQNGATIDNRTPYWITIATNTAISGALTVSGDSALHQTTIADSSSFTVTGLSIFRDNPKLPTGVYLNLVGAAGIGFGGTNGGYYNQLFGEAAENTIYYQAYQNHIFRTATTNAPGVNGTPRFTISDGGITALSTATILGRTLIGDNTDSGVGHLEVSVTSPSAAVAYLVNDSATGRGVAIAAGGTDCTNYQFSSTNYAGANPVKICGNGYTGFGTTSPRAPLDAPDGAVLGVFDTNTTSTSVKGAFGVLGATFTVAASGYISAPGQPFVDSVGTANNITSGAWSKTYWDTPITNIGGMWGGATSSGTFTAPATGVYSITCARGMASAKENITLAIKIDGVDKGEQPTGAASTSYSNQIHLTKYLTAGQTVECWLYYSTAGDANTSADTRFDYFQMVKLW